MEFGAVTFVLAETILGKTGAEVTHHHVARYLRDYAGGSDGETEAIAIDDCRLGKGERKNREAVDKNVLGRIG